MSSGFDNKLATRQSSVILINMHITYATKISATSWLESLFIQVRSEFRVIKNSHISTNCSRAHNPFDEILLSHWAKSLYFNPFQCPCLVPIRHFVAGSLPFHLIQCLIRLFISFISEIGSTSLTASYPNNQL